MGLPVLAIGSDRAWRARLERMLAMRGELDWRGTFPTDSLQTGECNVAALWLVDGDDPVVERACSRIRTAEPTRLHFYRHPNLTSLRRCAQIRGSGCLDKQAPPDVVRRAIRAVGIGLFAVDPSLLLNVLDRQPAHAIAAPLRGDVAAARWPKLTGRQSEIVHWASQGFTNKQIGRHLGISPETVKTHLHQIFEREGISDRGALLAAHRGAAAVSEMSA